MKPHAFHPGADAEYAAAAQYYATLSPELGGRFYDEIEGLILEIRNAPARFREYDPPARRNLARSFPYAIVYLDEPECVWILAIMHLHRAPRLLESPRGLRMCHGLPACVIEQHGHLAHVRTGAEESRRRTRRRRANHAFLCRQISDARCARNQPASGRVARATRPCL